MYQTINFSAFCDAFRSHDRSGQFTYNGKKALFDYLEDLEEQIGQRIELDVIALCCDYVEATFDEIREAYSLEDMTDEEVGEFISENTIYVGLVDDCILYANF